MSKFQSELETIEEKKKLLKRKEKEIKEKERKKQMKSYEKIGRFAKKASLPDIDDEALLGAFIELSENSKKEENLKKWRALTQNLKDKSDKENGTPLVIKFTKHPEKEIRDDLKEQGFKWNSFRGEFYGFGSLETARNNYKELGAQIEVID